MLTHVCISDLHAGAPTSLVMPLDDSDPVVPQPVTTTFATALGAFVAASGATPQLVLLGDLLDLQFSDRMHASRNGIGFLRAIREQTSLQDTVLATAGNHDHALWTDARLMLEAAAIRAPDTGIAYRTATPAFLPSSAHSNFLDAVVQEAGFANAQMHYPNIGFHTDDRAVVLHHGHFAEGAYHLISTIRDSLSDTPRDHLTVDEIAAENAGWIDFLWTSIGDAGFAKDASDLYQNLLTTKGYRRLSHKGAKLLGRKLSHALPMSGNITVQDILERVAQVGLDSVVGKYRDTERYAEIEALTAEGYEGLRKYLTGPVKSQMMAEITDLRPDTTFVFGHTHKPFSERVRDSSYPAPVKVYNSGGWTLNGPRLDNAEGAAIVLIDDALNVANLRIFGTPQNGSPPDIRVEMLETDERSATAFRADIDTWIAASQDAWNALRDTAAEAYRARQTYLLNLTAGAEAAE